MNASDSNPREPDAAQTPADPAVLRVEHPAEIAEALDQLPAGRAAEVLEALPPQTAAEALEQMPEQQAEQFLEEMEPRAAASALAHMAPDDAVDILEKLPEQRREDLLEGLPRPKRAALERLMRYPPESAGGVMSPQVTALPEDMPVPQAIARLREIAAESEQVYYTYVVDAENRLVGVLSLRDLLFANVLHTLKDIMIRQIVSVPVTMDREEVARLLSKYGYYAVPVVDEQDRLLGIITVDDVVDIIQQEATEDMQRMVGAGADERIDSPVVFVLRRRIPWLIINLGTGFLAASVVGAFERAIAVLPVLAVLQGIVAGQAGNTGLQSMAVVIRGLATGEMRGGRLALLVLREIGIGAASGLVVGTVAWLACYAWQRDVALSFVLGGAVLGSMLLSTVSGALTPWLMKRCGYDPAQSASIILTTITDVVGFGIFLALGSVLILSRRGG
jgi:magnesium transporter